MSDTDLDLLKRYTLGHAEEAFTEIVRRHVNLVHSAALRQVRSSQLAEEVAQSVFTDLARNAERLAPDTILTAWLYQVTRRTAIDVVRREARRQLREQIATEMNVMNSATADWTHIEPLLDEAVSALDDTDRAAVLLRFFENKSLREVGQQLGVSDDAAQKRVTRAVERLREFFAKRGVTVGAGGLVVVISANAVQAAPVGLAATISATALLTGTAVSTSTIIAATKTIALTTLQKTLVTATVAVLVGAGIHQAKQAANARAEVQTLQQAQAPLAEQIQQLQRERDEATNRLTNLLAENGRLKSNPNQTELLKLRGEAGRLRQASHDAKAERESNQQSDPVIENMQKRRLQKADQLYGQFIKQTALTSEEAQKFKELVVENEKQMERKFLNFLGPDFADATTNSLLLATTLAGEQAHGDQRIEELLGQDRYALYQAYHQTIEDRDGLRQFELESSSNTLNDDQREQLLRVMKEEEQKIFSETGIPVSTLRSTEILCQNWAAKKTIIEQYGSYDQTQSSASALSAQATLNQRIYERVKSIFTTEQLASFAAHRTEQLNPQSKLMER